MEVGSTIPMIRMSVTQNFAKPSLTTTTLTLLTLGRKKDSLKEKRSIRVTLKHVGSTVTIRQSTSTTANPPQLQKMHLLWRNQFLAVLEKTNQMQEKILPKLKSCLKSPKQLLPPLSRPSNKVENLPQQPHKQVQFLEVPNPQQNNLVTFLLHLCPKGKHQPFHKPQLLSQAPLYLQ
jgi:hypothetical protein